MRIADEWVNQTATVTAVLGLLLFSAVVWGRHFQAPWKTAEAVEVATLHGQQVARDPAEPLPGAPNPGVGTSGAGKVAEAPPAGDAAKADRGRVSDAARVEEKGPASPVKQEKHADANPDAGDSAVRSKPRPGTEQRETSWLSLLPE